MTFQIEISEKADRDLRNIFLDIAFDLCALQTAKKQMNRLWSAMRSLDELPERYRRYEDEPWRSRGMRVLLVDNYLIFYIPYMEEQVVYIMSVIYSGRDINKE